MGKLKPGNMVLIHIKKGEETNMLVDHDVSSEIDTVSRDCIMTYNMVLRARRPKSACDDLVQYGPMKPPELQCVLEDEEGSAADIEAMCKSNPHWYTGQFGRTRSRVEHYVVGIETARPRPRQMPEGLCRQQQSKSEQESMMQHYFKKKEEWKAMDDDDDDSYLTSAWANPKGMKNSLNGCGNVSWKPGM